MIDPNKICPGCMKELDDVHQECPYCGFHPEQYEAQRNARVLPCQTILSGRYMLGKVIGEGGFGITYLGWDLMLEMEVAVKEYFPVGLATRDTQFNSNETVNIMSGEKARHYETRLRGFEQEARNLAKFQDLPGVVSVKDFFFENQTAYLVMEYVEGISLKKYLQEVGRPLTEESVLSIMKPVLQSLGKIHKAGIIHRDISPENILIGKDKKVTLIDFGAARMATGTETKSLTILLKHGYAPVEQYQTRGRQGPWTDIYALCATIYKMCSGKVPGEAIDRMVEDDLKTLEELSRENPQMKVSKHLSDVIARGLAVKVEDRYQNVESLMDALYGGAEIPPTVPREEPLPKTEYAGGQNPPPYRPTPGTPSGYPPAGPAEKPPSSKAPFLIILLGIVFMLVIAGAVIVLTGGEEEYEDDNIVSTEYGREGSDDGGIDESADTGYGAEDEGGIGPAATATPSPAEITADLIDADSAKLDGLSKVNVLSASASSTINQNNGVTNEPMKMFDDSLKTNWEEGVEGSGEGEYVVAQFDQEYQVKYLNFWLGNWKSDKYYKGNNRPKTLTLKMGEFETQITFPDSKEKFCVELSYPCKASSLTIVMDEIYEGTSWDDTCISDVHIYGKKGTA